MQLSASDAFCQTVGRTAHEAAAAFDLSINYRDNAMQMRPSDFFQPVAAAAASTAAAWLCMPRRMTIRDRWRQRSARAFASSLPFVEPSMLTVGIYIPGVATFCGVCTQWRHCQKPYSIYSERSGKRTRTCHRTAATRRNTVAWRRWSAGVRL